MANRHISLVLMASAVAVALLLAAGWVILNGGITVVVRNVSKETLPADSYPLGDIPPGGVRKVVVQPTGESSVEVEIGAGGSGSRRLTADVYHEKGYRETLSLDGNGHRIVSKSTN